MVLNHTDFGGLTTISVRVIRWWAPKWQGTEMARDRNGYGPKWLVTDMASDRYG